MLKTRMARRVKAAMFAAVVATGGTVFTSCGVTDIRHNLIAGTQSFVKGYTADLWEAFFPPADEFVNTGGGNED